jgi:hypothetical protein
VWITWTVNGAAFIALAWSGITYAWMALLIARRAGRETECMVTAALVGVPMFLLAGVLAFAGGWIYFPMALTILFLPLVHCTVNQAEKPMPIPMYGRAVSQVKFGKYADAELEVISQLEKKENDFQGWMMLAELYATKYRRLEDAAQVVVDLCNDPAVQAVEISLACHKLADWQLEIGNNPQAARASMDLLIQRLPGTHIAEMAKLRLKQLPRTREDLLEKKQPRAIRLPALRERAGDVRPANDAVTKREATLEANRLSARLHDDPNNLELRERLAIILAEKLGQVNLGIEQLRLMIKLPEAHGERAAKWLGQIAEWEHRLNKNDAKFQAILGEIIRNYPRTSYAVAARRQLDLLEQEALAKSTVTMQQPKPTAIRLVEKQPNG